MFENRTIAVVLEPSGEQTVLRDHVSNPRAFRFFGIRETGEDSPSDPLISFNDACMNAFEIRRDGLNAIGSTPKASEVDRWAKQAIALLSELLVKDATTCMCDTGMALLAPIWRSAFEQSEIYPAFVIAISRPEVRPVNLIRKNLVSSQLKDLIWTDIVSGAERLSRGHRRLFVPSGDKVAFALERLLPPNVDPADAVEMQIQFGKELMEAIASVRSESSDLPSSVLTDLCRSLSEAASFADWRAISEASDWAATVNEFARREILLKMGQWDDAPPTPAAMAALRSQLAEVQRELLEQNRIIGRLLAGRAHLSQFANTAAALCKNMMASPLLYFREQSFRTAARALMKIPMLPKSVIQRSEATAKKREPNRFFLALDEINRSSEREIKAAGVSRAIRFNLASSVAASVHEAALADPQHYQEFSQVDLPSPLPVRTVAFYLPQFHPIPENDEWWGKGFTEWTNVTKALPRFLGHYQPRFPGELGYYDLRVPSVIAQQIRLAKTYGIYGFCFHYYWFGGRRILERPLELFKQEEGNGSFDFPFCINWANENWTRRWDGGENDILLAQDHSLEDHRAIFRDIARYISDRRYIRINGRPLILVYRPTIIDEVKAMCEIWRSEAEKCGFPGLEILATNSFGYSNYQRHGFDGLVQFPPHMTLSTAKYSAFSSLAPSADGPIYDYDSEVDLQIEQFGKLGRSERKRIFPCVFPGWDNEPRRPGRGTTFHGSTPGAFSRWFEAACSYTRDRFVGDERLVFVNAWNEWAEGAYLEPDRRFGYAYLQAIRDTILRVK